MSSKSISSSTKDKATVILIFRLLGIALFLSACSQDPLTRGLRLYQKGKTQEALPHLHQACQRENPTACKTLASIYASTDRVQMSQSLALACKYGDLPSCHLSARAYELLKSYQKMESSLQEGCRWGDPLLCATLARHYYQGRLLPQDKGHAINLWVKSCLGGERRACELAKTLLKDQDPSHPKLKILTQKLTSS